ncbi:hypothetical protein CERSUDRAFT_114751 [Gelatoporia subvermispora B]|uniref:BTB domain-containing protein n=1 Tax=Ceriporiopsis subvermispora (strain B) TaxID=914234 RepID=M2QXI8_CERS8|nr:hypothetical protein CERSUDRAFT_114751 [Gelatoporia subvermispora B]
MALPLIWTSSPVSTASEVSMHDNESRSSSPVDPHGPPSHHHEYYLEDEMSIFLVEGRLFKVHRYFLIRESEVFRTMFEMPPDANGIGGRTDEDAIPLLDVTLKEFSAFLKFVYHGMHTDRCFSLNDWTNLLSFSHRFFCDDIRERAIREIDAYTPVIDPVDKIVLGEKYDVLEWLYPSYEALCQRRSSITLVEAAKLGLTTTALLAQAREEVRACAGLVSYAYLGQGMQDQPLYDSTNVANVVRRVFAQLSPHARP